MKSSVIIALGIRSYEGGLHCFTDCPKVQPSFSKSSFCLINQYVDADEHTIFHTLTSAWPDIDWQEQYDVVRPFGDSRRDRLRAIWTINLDDSEIRIDVGEQSGRLPLSFARERLVKLGDFEPCEPSCAPSVNWVKSFPIPYLTPQMQVDPRDEAFLGRILRDFGHQWRHILRHRYNTSTFERLAAAIMRIVTTDFSVVELTEARLVDAEKMHVSSGSLPKWGPIKERLIPMGRVRFVLSQDPAEGLSIIESDMASQVKRSSSSDSPAGSARIYIILSVRHVIWCSATGPKLEWTQPASLFNATEPISDSTIALLLFGALPPRHRTTIQTLPLELQENILKFVSPGSVGAAKVGCDLGVGLPFTWKAGNIPIEAVESYSYIRMTTHLEWQLWFDEHWSGVSYTAKVILPCRRVSLPENNSPPKEGYPYMLTRRGQAASGDSSYSTFGRS